MAEPPPHARIRENGERSWTAALLAALPNAEADEREAIAVTLEALQDPRAVAPLTALLEDRSQPPSLRERLAPLLGNTYDNPPSPTIRRWWREGDEILRVHALRCMDARQADVVEAVVADPDHPHHAVAVGATTNGFEAPRHQAIKVAALTHPDAAVRVEAAEALAAECPVAAESALITATHDSDPDVVKSAATALSGYATRASVVALAALREADGPVYDGAVEALATIASDVRDAIAGGGPRDQAAIRRWVAPVADRLGLGPRDLSPLRLAFPVAPNPITLSDPEPEAEPESEGPVEPPFPDVWARVHDPDTPRAELRSLFPWALHEHDDPPQGARTLAHHQDSDVRYWATWCLRSYSDREGLVEQLGDPNDYVRAGASIALGSLDGPDPLVEAALWPLVTDPTGLSRLAVPALSGWCVHADPAVAVARLADLVRRDHRDPVRAHAVAALVGMGAVDAIDALLPLLTEPPRVTWHVHLALLGAADAFERTPPGLDALREVDDLHVQAAVAPWDDDAAH